jgi:hypothetical protein
MILFSGIESGRRFDLRHDWPLKTAALVQAGLRLFRRYALLGRVIKNHGTILVADIGALAIQRSRIVIRPEDIEELIVADDRGIELNPHHFSVPGPVSAHIFVGWIFLRAARVTDGCIRHTSSGPEGRFNAPKTTGAKCRFFCRHVFTMKREERGRKCRCGSPVDRALRRAMTIMAAQPRL